MTRPLCYIAAPYGAPTPEGVAWNVARAVLLGRLKLWLSTCPIIPHILVPPLTGSEEGRPEVREQALALGLDLLVAVRNSVGGQICILSRDDGSLSPGVAAECEVWGQGCASLAVTWANLKPLMTHAGLGSEWAALCAPAEDSAHGR